MRIRTKAFFIFTVTFLIFFAALVIFTGAILVADFRKVETAQVEKDATRAKHALNALEARLSDVCRACARWRGTSGSVQSGDEDIVKSDFVDAVFADRDVTFLIIANNAGRVLFSRFLDPRTRQVRPLPREILAAVRTSGLFSPPDDPRKLSRAGLLRYQGGVLLAAEEPILKSEAAAAGVCILGRFFDAQLVDELSEATLLRIRTEKPPREEAPGGAGALRPLESGGVETSGEGSGALVGRALVRDMFGAPALVLAVSSDQSFYRTVVEGAEYFTGATLFVALALMALSGCLLGRLIIRPIRDVSQGVADIARDKMFGGRLPVSGNDEIASLAREINGLLESLRLAGEDTAAQAQALRRARDAADHASRTKSEFLAKMNHEIRTPINTITGMADAVLREPSPAERREYLGMIFDAANQLQEIIDEVLDISRIESGRLELISTDFDLHLLARSVMRGAKAKADAKGLALRVSISRDAPRLANGDPGRLRQILANLVLNAVKFTEEGDVALSLESLNAEQSRPGKIGVFFEVADTGIGIRKDKLKAIFESFVQAEAGDGAGGAGLGLSIVKQLVALMGGEIDVQSTPGEGSVFSFSAYFDPPREPGKLRRTESPPPPAPREGYRILLVEDNPANRKIVELYLKEQPFILEAAENGRQALDKFLASSYDAVLMDMEMPVMDGYEATTRMRAFEKDNSREATPILALTAHAWTAQRERCFACGCSAFLPKPVTRAKLQEALYAHLSGSGATRNTTGPDRAQAKAQETNSAHAPLREPRPEEMRVHPDPEIRGLISGFIDSVQKDITVMRQTLNAGDLAAMGLVGRSLKGAGTSYGFPFVGEAGASIERAAKEKQAAQAEQAVDALERYLERVEIV